MTIGFRVKRTFDRIPADRVDSFRALPVANVSDSMSRMIGSGARLRPMHRAGGLAGPALTVKTRPGDNLMIHKAVDIAQPGDVIVCDAGGDVTNALIGELILAHALERGVAGFILYGAIRDAEAIGRQDLPVYALGITHRGPSKHGPGEVGFPIALDGMIVAPGDLMLGDRDGVVCVPRGDAETVLAASRRKSEAEARQMEETLAGTMDRRWVDRVLAEGGCEFLD